MNKINWNKVNWVLTLICLVSTVLVSCGVIRLIQQDQNLTNAIAVIIRQEERISNLEDQQTRIQALLQGIDSKLQELVDLHPRMSKRDIVWNEKTQIE